MTLIQKLIKPKTRKGRIAIEKKEPKFFENEKTAVFLRGVKASEVVVKCMKDLCSLKKPQAVFFNGRNDWLPFDNVMPLELFCEKQDASLFMFGNHNKKRAHNLIIGRMFDHHLLDMFEFGIEKYRSMAEFKKNMVTFGSKPCLLFAGEPFLETFEYQRLKSLLIDFFRGTVFEKMALSSLEYVLMFTAVEDKIHMRSYRVQMKKSGTKIPRIELEEIGPSVDFTMRRNNLASNDLFKTATKQPKEIKPKKVKNKEVDVFGAKLGRIHVPKQDISRLQVRKTKVLRKTGGKKKAKNAEGKRNLAQGGPARKKARVAGTK